MLRLMIALSDNDATNAVIGLTGLEAVDQTCGRLGLAQTHLRRMLMDFAATAAGIDNVTCVQDLAQVMAGLRGREALREAETVVELGPGGGVDRGSIVLPTFANIGGSVWTWLGGPGSPTGTSDTGRTDVLPGLHRP